MNIVFLLRYIDSGGITRVVYDSSSYLTDKGYKVFIFYGKFLGKDNSFKRMLESNPNIRLIKLRGFSLELSSVVFFPFSFFFYLYNLLVYKIDIIHLHWMSLSFVCVLSKLFLNIPFLTTTHLINKSTSSFTRFYSLYNISISSEISTWLNTFEKVKGDYIYKIFNSVSERDFPFISPEQRKLNKSKLGFSNKIILLSLARFETVKRHDIIIDALYKLKDFNFMLFLAGEGKLISDVRNLVENRKLSEKVKFVGHVDPRELLSFSDVIILTSDQEGFPMSIIEAMFSGVVPIRTNAEGANDQIINRQNGFIIDKSNVEELTCVLNEIFNKNIELDLFSKKSYEYAIQNFDFINNQNKIIEIYKLIKNKIN
jgi:glycosyltransferase involved in cell wall biosynthesis